MDMAAATFATLHLVVTAGFVVFCLLIVRHLGLDSRVGRSWIPMVVAGAVLMCVSVVTLDQSLFATLAVPSWWREFSALLFRVTLFISVVIIYRAWTSLAKFKG